VPHLSRYPNHYTTRATHIFVITMYISTFIAKQLNLTQLLLL